jgi:hypothetical protein
MDSGWWEMTRETEARQHAKIAEWFITHRGESATWAETEIAATKFHEMIEWMNAYAAERERAALEAAAKVASKKYRELWDARYECGNPDTMEKLEFAAGVANGIEQAIRALTEFAREKEGV